MLTNKTDREEKMKKLHSLLDKYNDDVAALEDAAGADAFEYLFAKPYLDEVLEERRGRKQESSKTNEKGIANAAKTIYDIYQKSDADNPLKTGNFWVDFVIGRNKYAKAWNIGYNLGKAAFVAEQAYKELYKFSGGDDE